MTPPFLTCLFRHGENVMPQLNSIQIRYNTKQYLIPKTDQKRHVFFIRVFFRSFLPCLKKDFSIFRHVYQSITHEELHRSTSFVSLQHKRKHLERSFFQIIDKSCIRWTDAISPKKISKLHFKVLKKTKIQYYVIFTLYMVKLHQSTHVQRKKSLECIGKLLSCISILGCNLQWYT